MNFYLVTVIAVIGTTLLAIAIDQILFEIQKRSK